MDNQTLPSAQNDPSSLKHTGPKMDPELKQRWVDALRSGEYRQARERLKVGDAYCCLGVLCKIQDADFSKLSSILVDLKEWNAGTTLQQRLALALMNDEDNRSFAEIADWIESNL